MCVASVECERLYFLMEERASVYDEMRSKVQESGGMTGSVSHVQ